MNAVEIALPDLVDDLVREYADSFYSGLYWARPKIGALVRIALTELADAPRSAALLRVELQKSRIHLGRPETPFLVRKGLNELLSRVARSVTAASRSRLAAAAALLGLNMPTPIPALRDVVSNHHIFTRQARTVVAEILEFNFFASATRPLFESLAGTACDDVQPKSKFLEKFEDLVRMAAPRGIWLPELEAEAGLELDNMMARKQSPLLRLAARLLRSVVMDPCSPAFRHLRDVLLARPPGDGVTKRLLVASMLVDSRKSMDTGEWRRSIAICLLLAAEIPDDHNPYWHRMFKRLEADQELPTEFRDLARSFDVGAVAPISSEHLRRIADVAEGRVPGAQAPVSGGTDETNPELPPARRRAAGKRRRRILVHAPDYSWVKLRGRTIPLTSLQASIIRLLHARAKTDTPEIGEKELLKLTTSQSAKLRELFKGDARSLEVYNTLIKRLGRGLVRLNYK